MPKSIMIIGAGPGIGRAVAEKFGHEGWIVILTGRNTFRLDVQAAELTAQGIIAHAVHADATRPAELRKAIAKAERLTGGLTTVLYNAAVVRQQDLFSMADREIAEDLAINIAGGLHTIRTATSMFGRRGGTILVTGGGLGVTPHPSYASLGVGKAGLRNIVQALAEPLSSQGIRIAIATVATLVAPNSPEAQGVAETMWKLANDPQSGWEATYPAA